MGFKDRIRRLERTEHADVIKLSDGTEIRLGPFDRLEGLLATIDGEAHWLHEALGQPPADAPPHDIELAQLLKALRGDKVGF